MSSQRNPLTESIDELLREQRAEPFHRYLMSRDGLRDWVIGSALAGLCFVASYFIVRANVF